MPVDLVLEPVGSILTIRSNDLIMTAITGIVMNGQIIEIENLFVNAREPPIAPYNFDFWIFSSKN